MSVTELFLRLFSLYKDRKLVWPNKGSFEVVVGAILVQNTAWRNVLKALENLKNANALSVDGILNLSVNDLAILIKPSGFYNTKAKRLNTLIRAIKSDFGDFENFKNSVSREWLLAVKGVGFETTDAILTYACFKPEAIASAYAARILATFGYEFESYDELKEYLSEVDFAKIYKITNLSDENAVFDLFHLMIIEFCKDFSVGKKISQKGLEILNF